MKRLICLAVCLCWAVAFAQKAPTEVSLVVSADGPSKTEAVNNALRSAIEQSFGTFVSANTEILNDELVKDEIATVSSGNIQNYSEVASVSLPNGNTSVTLNVTVSLSKLVSYAQSKGSQCEIAGATFGANRRLYEFNKKNEQIAIQNMFKQLDALRPIYDYEMEVSEPIFSKSEIGAYVDLKITAKSNEKTKIFYDIIRNTLSSLAMREDVVLPLKNSGFKVYRRNVIYGDSIRIERWGEKELITDNSKSMKGVYFYNEYILHGFKSFITNCQYDFQVIDNLNDVYFIAKTVYEYAPDTTQGEDHHDDDGCSSVVVEKLGLYTGDQTDTYSFLIPKENLERISNIKILPSKQLSSTNIIESCRYNAVIKDIYAFNKALVNYGFITNCFIERNEEKNPYFEGYGKNDAYDYRLWSEGSDCEKYRYSKSWYENGREKYYDDYIDDYVAVNVKYARMDDIADGRPISIFIKGEYNKQDKAIKEINSNKKQY